MASSNFPGRPFALRENVWLIRQEGNSSLVGWQLWIDKRSTSPSFSDSFTHRWFQLDGVERGSTYNNGYDFRGGGPWLILSGETWMGHDSAGFKTFSIRGWANYDQLGATEVNSVFTLPRIPKVPQKPAKPSLSNFTPTSVRVNGSVPDDMGSGIQEYQFAASPTNGAAQTFTSNAGQIHDVQGLAPGQTYNFQYRARNGVGWSDWSDGEVGTPGLPAPTLTSWTQNTTGGLVARWTPPAATNGLTGYRVRLATDAEFTRNVQTADFGDVTSGTVVGLPGGRRYFAQVAAVTAGGVNAYSNVLDTMLVLESGNLDGWTRYGTKPANIAYYTAAGVRRGTVGTRQALYLESLSTGAVSIDGNTTGLQRTIATTPGKAYRFSAAMTSGFAGAPTGTQGRSYRLSVGSVLGDVAVLSGSAPIALPTVEFVATAQSTAIRILLADNLSIPGQQDQVEAVAFSQISVGQINTDYPQRLRSTVFESDLASHFDLACNSVGATWFVDTLGQTRFQLPGNALPVSAIFSDLTTDGHLNYVEPQAGYDIKSTVNRLEAENKGWDPVEDVELNDTLLYENRVSMDLNGTYTERVAVNLYDLPPYEYAVPARLDEILDAHDEPELLVSSVRWNAQQDMKRAAALEIGQRVTVIFNGITQDSQIVSLQHDIQPTRWMITVHLQKLA